MQRAVSLQRSAQAQLRATHRRCTSRRPLRVNAYVTPRQELTAKVHAWFENILHDEEAIDALLAPHAVLTDHLNEACYRGPANVKHRLAVFHQQHLQCDLVELGAVTDVEHGKVCAHWVCTPKPGAGDDAPLYGTSVFVFDADGKIAHVSVQENPTFATIRNPKWQQAAAAAAAGSSSSD